MNSKGMHQLKRFFQIQLICLLLTSSTAYGQLNFTVNLPDLLVGETGSATFEVSGFTDITSAQFTINYDPNVLAFNSINFLNLPGLEVNDFNTINSGDITFFWYAPISGGITLTNNTVIFSFEFTAISGNGDITSITFGNSPVPIEFSKNAVVLPNGDYSLINGSAIIGEQTSSCNRMSDSLALVELYNATGGDNWTYSELTNNNGLIPNAGNPWNFNSPIDTWHGVELDINGCVLVLALNNNGLSSELIDLNLSSLEIFNCSNNTLTGEIPDFTNLLSLESFDCSFNGLAGEIPDFTNLSILKLFNCRDNELTGAIPNFTNLSMLKFFRCSSNKLAGEIPDFANLSILESFNCGINEIVGEIPDFTNLSSLESFSCYNNELTGEIPNFTNLPVLESFSCYNNELTGEIPNFTNLLNLKSFDCGINELAGEIPDFTNLSILEFFNCSFNGLMGEIPDFTNLSILKLFNCRVNVLTGEIPNFANLSSLESFNCSFNGLTGEIPDLSDNCPSLRAFYSSSNQFTFEDILPSINANVELIESNQQNPGDSLRYNPQDFIFMETTYTQMVGDELSVDIGIDENVPDNVYTWYKEGVEYPVPNSNSNTLNFTNIQLSAAGTYWVHVTNPGAPLLTLESYPFEIAVESVSSCDRASDSLALVELYNATGGDNWTYIELTYDNLSIPNAGNPWNSNLPIHDWHGVTVNIDGCVVDLLLFKNGLNGQLIDLNLPELINFNCTLNALTGSIPDFTNLPSLEIFNCSYNGLTGEIPDFANLPILEVFNCRNNDLTGEISDFVNLPILEVFNCLANDLTGEIPDFANLPDLESFDCGGNDLTGEIPDFANLPDLESFDCDGNDLTGEIPDFANLSSMRSFSCRNNGLTGEIPNFTNLSILESFNCVGNDLTGEIPDFTNLPILEFFDCAFNRLTGEIPNFTNLFLLEAFGCLSNELTGEIPNFTNLSSLETFVCSDNGLTGEIPNFANLSSLEIFSCSHNDLTGEIPDLSDNCPELKLFYNYDNQFTFENILPSINANVELIESNQQSPEDSLRYNPQGFIFMETTYTQLVGDDLWVDIGIDENVPDNVYTWYKEGVEYPVPNSNSNTLNFTNIQLSDAATYWVHVTNPGAPLLILESYPFEIVVESVSTCIESDSLTLVALYNSTNGANWTTSWNLSQPISTWEGVELNAEGCVTNLQLDNNNLVGQLVELNMEYLEQFSCPNNSLTGSIPDLNNVPSLTQFGCFNNSLTGAIPDLSNVPNLEFFGCDNNGLTGNIPDLNNVPSLKNFFCSNNNLTGGIPDLSNVPSLENFFCSNNNLTVGIPDLSNVPSLILFFCDNNNLTGSIPDLTNVPNLQFLACSSNSLTGSIPDLTGNPNLTGFACSNNGLTGSIPDLTNVPNLIEFYCSSNGLTGGIPDLSNVPNLNQFFCSDNSLTGSIPDLPFLPNLERFACSENNFTGEIPDLSNNCPMLRYFYFDENQFTFENILPSIDGNETLVESNAEDVTDILQYNPQDSFFMETTYMLIAGEDLSINLGIDENISDNIYTWYQNGVEYGVTNPNSNTLAFTNIQTSDAGIYWVHVTNPGAPLLTLESFPFEIVVESVSTCIQSDSLTLIALYNSTNGINWTIPWDLSQPMNTWYGVEINSEGCVTCIDLDGNADCLFATGSGNNLQGMIPSELGNLTQLTHLSLNSNTISGTIPIDLGNLINLTWLDLAENSLTNFIPGELGNLNNLVGLNIHNNQLAGEIPSSLGDLSQLLFLSISGNNLTGSIPASLGNLTQLNQLWLRDNELSGEIPSELGNLTNLTAIFLHGNNLEGCFSSTLSFICNLEHNPDPNDVNGFDGYSFLNNPLLAWEGDFERFCNGESELGASCNDGDLLTINDEIDNNCECVGTVVNTCVESDSLVLIALYNSTNGGSWTETWDLSLPMSTWYGVETNTDGCVTCIDLDGNPDCLFQPAGGNDLQGTIPSELGNLTQLIHLSLNNNNLSGFIPSELGNLISLEWLDFGNNSLTGTVPSELGDLSNLVGLGIFTNELSGEIPSSLGNISGLLSLSLSGNNLTGSIPTSLGSLTELNQLWLRNNELSGEIPMSLGNLTNLERLYLNDNNFEGCHALFLSFICDLGHNPDPTFINGFDGYSFLNNPLLAWEGDFERFCNGESEIGASCDDGDLLTINDQIDNNCECAGTVVNSCVESDSLVLIALYNSTNGSSWTIPWDLSQPMSTWYGVETNTDGCVTCIDLDGNPDCLFVSGSGNNVVGMIPPELGSLNQLTHLSLNNNSISGTIPNEIGNLINLSWLDFGNNSLTGSIPSELGNLVNVVGLNIFSNQLSGQIPTSFGGLSSVIGLSLSSNNLTGSIPTSLGNLTQLKQLWLRNNELSGEIPMSFENLTNLERLYLNDNNLESCFPESLSFVCNLAYNPNPSDVNGFDGYSFLNNSLLPWQGDYERICNGEEELGASCDDGDPATQNDVTIENCECQGDCAPLIACDINPCTNGGTYVWDVNTCNCVLAVGTIEGCTDVMSCNYNPSANCDDGSCNGIDSGNCNTDCTIGDLEIWDAASCQCIVNIVTINGCMDSNACNYNPNATCDDGSCISATACDNNSCTNGGIYTWNSATCECVLDEITIEGCVNPTACNYNPSANCNDFSCVFQISCDDGNCTNGQEFWNSSTCACDVNFSELSANIEIITEVSCSALSIGEMQVDIFSGEGEIKYDWEGPDGFTSNQQNLTGLISGVYTVTVTDENICIVENIMLSAPENPIVEFDIMNVSCIGETGAVSVDVVNNRPPPFLYRLNGAEVDFESVYEGLSPGIYELNVIDSEGCESFTNFEITQPDHEIPQITSSDDDLIITQGEEITLEASVEADTYQWTTDGEGVLNCDNCREMTTKPIRSATTPSSSNDPVQYVLETQIDGCDYLDTLSINIRGSQSVFVITCNDDGINDALFIPELEDDLFDLNNELVIFNRWGETVFTAKPYNNDWCGIDQQGNTLSEGTYYFIIRLDISRGIGNHGRVVLIKEK